ncbi:DnaJ domain-containing protein [Haloarchaeobius sp. DFWS5]|uniref:J domain-containing protein n=1 Tax=Haloarchaeobius sp. DFWS5 TaxID=3446114 RepID=UPI003EBD3D5B
MTKTFYDVLGVAPDATQDEITAAFRRRVKETHPDLSDAEDASEEFQRVTEAEEVLGDPDERARYDRLGHASYTGSFSDHFGQGRTASETESSSRDDERRSRAQQRSRNRRRSYPGSDQQAADAGNSTNRSYSVGDQETTTDGGGATNRAEWWASDRGDQYKARRETRSEREHVAEDDEDEAWDGYSVHDWDEDELETEPVQVRLTQNMLVIVVAIFVMYPLLAFTTIAPGVGILVNVTIGACTLLLCGYLLTIPRISSIGFGALSVFVPLLLSFLGVSLLDPASLFVLGACWVPFGYAVLFSRVLSSPS